MRKWIALAVAGGLVVSACSGGAGATTTIPSPPPVPATTSAPGTTPPPPHTTTTTSSTTTTSAPTTTTTTTSAPTTTSSTTTTTTVPPPPPGVSDVTLTVGAASRRYTLYVPPEAASGPVPLVLDFHGFTSDPDRYDRQNAMRAQATAAGFALAQPAANLIGNAWDPFAGSPDVEFGLAVIADVSARLAVDRVFASGFSNGGALAARIACDAPGALTAIGIVSAAHFGWAVCERTEPIPVLAFHGTADRVVPYEGAGSVLPPVEGWSAQWAAGNGCSDSATEVITDDVDRLSWTGCRAAVALYRIRDGGHAWPGPPNDLFFDTTDSISATELIWQFFASQ